MNRTPSVLGHYNGTGPGRTEQDPDASAAGGAVEFETRKRTGEGQAKVALRA